MIPATTRRFIPAMCHKGSIMVTIFEVMGSNPDPEIGSLIEVCRDFPHSIQENDAIVK
jgi:hypothetical protein